MSLTKEMIMSIEREVRMLGDTDLLIYYHSYRNINNNHPNSYDRYKVETAFIEIYERGLENRINEFSSYW